MKTTINKNIQRKVNVDITDINYEGMGIASLDGKCLFVEGAITGENVDCIIDFENKSFYRGHSVQVHTPSIYRQNPKCEVYDRCGGCQLLHLCYQESLKYKLKSVNNTLKRIGGIDFEVKEILGMDKEGAYRNKVQIKAGEVDGHLVLGYFEKRSHNIVPFKNCILQSDEINEMTNFIKNILNEYHLKAYDENTKQGDIKHVMIRENKNKEVMIVFVTSKNKIEHENDLVNKLLNRYNNIVSIIKNINEKDSNVILGDKFEVLYGKDEIIDEILGLKFKISHYSFFQVNREQTQKLYSKVLEYVGKAENIVDAYCGVGSISLNLAKNAKQVYGIEIVKEAIDNANANKELNNINNVKFILGKVEDKIFELLEEKTIDCVVIDPPRKGLDIKVIDALKETNINKIIYVSCNPATLARDLGMLKEKYDILDMCLVDMFAYTNGVETVCLLTNRAGSAK